MSDEHRKLTLAEVRDLDRIVQARRPWNDRTAILIATAAFAAYVLLPLRHAVWLPCGSTFALALWLGFAWWRSHDLYREAVETIHLRCCGACGYPAPREDEHSPCPECGVAPRELRCPHCLCWAPMLRRARRRCCPECHRLPKGPAKA